MPRRASAGARMTPTPSAVPGIRMYSASRWRQVEALYHAARERAPEARAAFLADACAQDEDLRREVESLLVQPVSVDGVLDGPALAVAPPLVSDPDGTSLVGRRLGIYQVLAPLGAGGMGEVYRARDTRLGRDVALKVLPREVSDDADRVARLEREARLLAALNHPHIATIYGVEDFAPAGDAGQGAVRALVLELVEGDTLAERIRRPGPGRTTGLSIADTLAIARQIADALDAAHEKGIVHRDLKPANVKITPEGVVKVLDFGLAKLAPAIDPDHAAVADSPTMMVAGTREGLIVGTAAYMSPEQARGQAVDKRTDIWAFGCVLYEMVTGRGAFARDTLTDTLAAVVEREPDWSALPSEMPQGARHLLERCLCKHARHRLRDIGEARIQLEEISLLVSSQESTRSRGKYDSAASNPTPTRIARRVMSRRLVLAGAIVVLAVVTAVMASRLSLFVADGRPAVRTLAVLPLKSLAGKAEENYVGVAIADSIIMGMSRASSLTVRPTSAVRRYAAENTDALEAAKTLEVDAVLDGTWHREGDRLRLSVNLLRSSDGRSLWTDTFDTRAGDVFAIQDQVSKGLVSRLQLQLDRGQRPRDRRAAPDTEAYDAYAKAMFYFAERGTNARERGNSETAIELFQRAIRLDEDYAEAHAMLGFAYAWRAVFIEDNPALITRAEEETRVAERIDASLGQIHLTRGFILWSWYGGWRIAEAIRELRLARELDPALSDLELGGLFHHLGFFNEWRQVVERALELDPTNRQMKVTYVNNFYLANLPEEGLAAQKGLLDEGPDDRYFLLTGRVQEAAPFIEQNAARNPKNASALARLALLRALQGRHREAQDMVPRVLDTLQKNRAYHHVTYDVARVFALSRRGVEAARWLEETIRWGFPNHPLFAEDRWLDPVRDAPEMKAVMADLKVQWDRYRAQLH